MKTKKSKILSDIELIESLVQQLDDNVCDAINECQYGNKDFKIMQRASNSLFKISEEIKEIKNDVL